MLSELLVSGPVTPRRHYQHVLNEIKKRTIDRGLTIKIPKERNEPPKKSGGRKARPYKNDNFR